jgi:hypothetical protein
MVSVHQVVMPTVLEFMDSAHYLLVPTVRIVPMDSAHSVVVCAVSAHG